MKNTDFNKIDTNNENCTKKTYYPIKIIINRTTIKNLFYEDYMAMREDIERLYNIKKDFKYIMDELKIGYSAIFRIAPSLYRYQ